MSLVLDAIVILIILLFVFLSAKKGFVRTLIEVVGFVAAIILALSFSTPISNFVYDKTIEPIVVKTVEKTINDGAENINSAVDSFWNELPAFLSQNSFLGLSKEGLTNSITGSSTDAGITLSNTISQSFLKPAVTKLLSALISVILVIILLFVVKILAKYINKLFNFSVVGDINKTLGGILGLVKGAAVAVIFCLVISLILSFTKDGFLIFTYDTINSSYIFKFLFGFSPFI